MGGRGPRRRGHGRYLRHLLPGRARQPPGAAGAGPGGRGGGEAGGGLLRRGEGGAGRGGAPKGDLYLVISVSGHPLFEREGDNLKVEVPVPLRTAMLGGEVEVPTMKGKVALKVPPETQNGQV